MISLISDYYSPGNSTQYLILKIPEKLADIFYPAGQQWPGQGWPLVVYGHFVVEPRLSQSETAGDAVLLAHWEHVGQTFQS